jgi:hypothetical protein
MEEVRGPIPLSSTSKLVAVHALGSHFIGPPVAALRLAANSLAGFVAGEGSFYTTRAGPDRNDGSPRTRFIFQLTIARHDRPLLQAMRAALGGVGSIQDIVQRRPNWLPLSTYRVSSRYQTRSVLIPFFDEYLVPSAKRDQFDRWRVEFENYERAHPTQWGKGPSICSEPGCEKPVRGRGLCRSHYYRATGY